MRDRPLPIDARSDAAEVARNAVPDATIRPRRFGISTILVAIMTTAVLLLVIVPGRGDEGLHVYRYEHGWPCVYLERVGVEESCWRLNEHIIWWSLGPLALDALCAGAVVAAVVVSYERWRRRPNRYAISLRSAIVLLTALSIAMFLGTRWVALRYEVARAAREEGWPLKPVPTWFAELLPVGSAGNSPEDYLSPLLLRPDFHEDGINLQSIPSIDDDTYTLWTEDSDWDRLIRRIDLAPENFRLSVRLDSSDPEILRRFARMRGCLILALTVTSDGQPLVAPLISGLPKLESLELSLLVEDQSQSVSIVIEAVAEPSHLRAFSCKWFTMTDTELELLQRFSNLESLSCAVDGDVNSGALQQLERLPKLRHLELGMWGTRLTSLSGLTRLRRLQSLSLMGCSLNLADIELLVTMPGLVELDLGNCDLSGSAFNRLGSLRHLRILDVSEISIDGKKAAIPEIAPLVRQLEDTIVIDVPVPAAQL